MTVGRPFSVHYILPDAYAIVFKKDLSGEAQYAMPDLVPDEEEEDQPCLLYTSPSPRDRG